MKKVLLIIFLFLAFGIVSCGDLFDDSSDDIDTSNFGLIDEDGVLNTYNSNNTTAWKDALGDLLPEDYPIPASHVSTIDIINNPYVVYIMGLESESQIKHIINTLKEYYEANTNDSFETTFEDSENNIIYYMSSASYSATHVESEKPHSLSIITSFISYNTLTSTTGTITLMYDFSSTSN